MKPTRIRRHRRSIVVALVAITALSALTGCSGIAASRSGAGLTAPTPGTRTRIITGTAAPTNSGGSGAGGAGSLTAALSKPIAVSGHVDTTVSCFTGRHYTATAGPVVIDGTSISLEVIVAGYSAPGAYTAVVTASVTPSGSDGTDVAGLPGIPVTITSSGGTVNLSATGTAGRVIAGSLTWACS